MNNGSPGGLWRDPFAPRESRLSSGVRVALVVAAHVGVMAVVAIYAVVPDVQDSARELVVRLIEPPRQEIQPPRPKPPKLETPRPTAPPPPVLAAAAEAPASPAFAVAPQPPAPPTLPPIQAAPAPPAPPAPITAARFDADYLHNPKPVYPMVSRRQGEEGKVQLRVRVSAEGTALEVEIRQSSGYPRLDAAARDAVAQWRFVPAKQGDAPVEAWVGVPIVFKLDS